MFHVQESILKLLFDSVISTINAKVAENGELCRDFQSKSWIHTHTKKKDEGDLSSSKSLLQGAEKDMDEIKTAMGLQENKKIVYLRRTKHSRVSGIQESAGGTCEVVESKVRDQGYG